MACLLNVKFGIYNTFYSNCYISNSFIGDFVYVGERTQIRNTTIGKFCSIASDVKIGLGMHPTNFISTFPAFFSTKKQCQFTFAIKNHFEEMGSAKIGNDVWIGVNAIIMDNVTIEDGAIIAAGSVVTKDVEPYAIVGGCPARLIRKRFSDDKIEKLLKLKWWNKEYSWLKENYTLLTDSQALFETNENN